MNQKRDIETEEDIQLMVNTFYEKVNQDKLLSPIFNDIAKVDWEHHLPKMYQFWNFVILGITGYRGQPFPIHAVLQIGNEHFNRWITIFKKNIDEHFSGPRAEMAKSKAENLSLTFQYKLGIGNSY